MGLALPIFREGPVSAGRFTVKVATGGAVAYLDNRQSDAQAQTGLHNA